MEKAVIQMEGGSETLLLPLRARYLESKRSDGILSDPKSIDILDQIEYDFSQRSDISKGSQIGVCIRTEILDEQVTQFISQHENAVVVNLGCGLDTRFHRIDNGTVTWFDLDLPDAIELRKKFFTETDRYHFLPFSFLQTQWFELIPKDRPLLFVAEGLLMYFSEQDNKKLFQNLSQAFPGSDVLFEAMAPIFAKNTHRHPEVKHFDATFKWGLSSGRDVEQWGMGISFIDEFVYFERHQRRYPLMFKLLCLIPAFRKGMKIVHLRFA